MRMRPNLLVTIGLSGCLALLASCRNGPSFGSGGQNVRVAADDTANFSAYHTYVFLPGQLSADAAAVKVTSDELDRRMSAALASKLPAKGLRPATGNDSGDLYVTYIASVRREAEIVHAGGGRGQPGGYDEPGAIAPGDEWGVRSFDEGALVLQFTDARTRAGVWRATVTSEVVENSRALERALDAALKSYPPKKK
jgi:hypothetical protein